MELIDNPQRSANARSDNPCSSLNERKRIPTLGSEFSDIFVRLPPLLLLTYYYTTILDFVQYSCIIKLRFDPGMTNEPHIDREFVGCIEMDCFFTRR